jgi:ATP-dependent helicase/nuclease subunit A
VRIVDAAGRLRATATAMRVADDLAAGWKLGARFAEAYALAKRDAGLADFDDLITLAGTLLRVSSFGEWVRFKLDQRTDHILVDEAQDTNMRQWGIVLSLAEEFFAGVSAKDDRLRTLFTVGDRKQAIFGFQGTEPKAFATARDMFHAMGEMGGQPFRQVDLVSNYRSTPAVLDVVDRWLGDGGSRPTARFEAPKPARSNSGRRCPSARRSMLQPRRTAETRGTAAPPLPIPPRCGWPRRSRARCRTGSRTARTGVPWRRAIS